MEKRIEDYDVVVIGGGAGGMTAALYAGRARLKTLLMEKSLIGGLATYTSEIENYPGFPEGIDGTELMKLFDKQFRKFGVNVKLTADLMTEDGMSPLSAQTIMQRLLSLQQAAETDLQVHLERKNSLIRASLSAQPVMLHAIQERRFLLLEAEMLPLRKVFSLHVSALRSGFQLSMMKAM